MIASFGYSASADGSGIVDLGRTLNTAFARIVRTFFVSVIILASGGMEKSPVGAEVDITIRQLPSDRLEVTYKLSNPQRALLFSAIPGRYRETHWEIKSKGFKIRRRNGRTRIERLDGERFSRVTITAAPAGKRLTKQYQPISQYGVDGLMVYTGHFWPVSKRGGRMSSAFTFIPENGGKIVAFGEHTNELSNWRSPHAHPSFVYMGPLTPVETADVMAIVDPDAPQWIMDDFYEMTPRALAHLSEEFGFSLPTKPNLFLAAPLGKEEGRLRYAGDALPGQFQITLAGAAWKNRTPQAISIFRSSTVHEAVHLWQAAARPVNNDVASWIHEGGADAIAAETLVAIGYWEPENYTEYFLGAREECAGGLELGPLSSAEKRDNFRVLYACGHVIAEAVSIAENRSVTHFWRDFVERARTENGYTEETYFELVQERTGDQAFVDKLRDFVRTPLANPDREIGRLLAAAHMTAQNAPLAPAQGR